MYIAEPFLGPLAHVGCSEAKCSVYHRTPRKSYMQPGLKILEFPGGCEETVLKIR